MKQVAVREVQVKLSSLLKEIPFEITRYGKVVARVIPAGDELRLRMAGLESSEDVTTDVTTTTYGYCEDHFEKNKFPLKEFEYEDKDGNVLWKKKLCERCKRKWDIRVRNEGGILRETNN